MLLIVLPVLRACLLPEYRSLEMVEIAARDPHSLGMLLMHLKSNYGIGLGDSKAYSILKDLPF